MAAKWRDSSLEQNDKMLGWMDWFDLPWVFILAIIGWMSVLTTLLKEKTVWGCIFRLCWYRLGWKTDGGNLLWSTLMDSTKCELKWFTSIVGSVIKSEFI